MESLNDMTVNKVTKRSNFSGEKICYKLTSILMLNEEKWDAKLVKWGGAMPTFDLLIFMCCWLCPSNFQCFKVMYHEYPFAFYVKSIMPWSQEHNLGWPAYSFP